MQGRLVLTFLFFVFFSSLAHALEKKTFCVWDPVGRTGPVMTFYSDVIPKAQAWGLNLKFNAYTEETDAVADFKAGKCEAAVLTSILSRQFVKFAGTMDAVGAINSEKGLELAIATLSRPRAGNLMVEGNYEVVTTFPVGSMYAFVKDRNVDTIDDFKGKTLAVLNDDPQMKMFAKLAGATPVNVLLSNFDDMFNKGQLDILIMPALAYNTFELYNGLGKKGGIIDYRLYYGMLQTIARRDHFPEGFGDKMRNYMLTRMKAMNKMVKDAEEEIPGHYWINTNQFVKDDIDRFSERVRLALKRENLNNPAALKLFWKIRCRLDPSRGECKDAPAETIANKKPKSAKKKNVAKKTNKPVIKSVSKAKNPSNNKLKLAQENIKIEQQKLEKDKAKLASEKAKLNSLKSKLDSERKELENLRRQIEQQKQELAEERKAFEQAKLEKQKLELKEDEELFVESNSLESDNFKDDNSLETSNSEKDAQIAALEQAPPPAAGIKETDEKEKKSWSLWEFLFGWI